MSEQENIAVVTEAYNNFKTGNINALVDQMTDDVVWQLPEIKNVPLAGKRTGRDGVADFFATLARDQDVIEFEPRKFVAQHDTVVTLGYYQWHVKRLSGSDDRHQPADPAVFLFLASIGKEKIIPIHRAKRRNMDTV